MDVAKLGVASFAAWGVGSALLASSIVIGPLAIAVAVFATGFLLAITFNILDEQYKITETLTKKLREIENIPETERYWKGNR